MAEKIGKPCKRRKSDTLEAAVKAGLELLGEPKEGKSKMGNRKTCKPAHIRLVKAGAIRQTHTPYRSRVKSYEGDLHVPQPCMTDEHGNLVDSDGDGGSQIDEDIDGELEDIISECNELLKTQPSKHRAPRTWSNRMADLQSSWEENRSTMFEILVGVEFLPENASCSVCLENPASIRCHHCGDSDLLCHQCDRLHHTTNPFHDREAWFEKCFKSIQSCQTVTENGQVLDADCFIPFSNKIRICTQCGNKSFKAIPARDMSIVVTMQGRFDVNSSTFVCGNCSCMAPLTVKDVLHYGYWPASPSNLNTLFSQDLFLTWDTFQKRMPGCSETSFVRSLEDISLTKGRIGTINPRTFAKAFREWKYFKHELDVLQAKDWLRCPCCSSNQHSCHVDGNMKLYRYKRSGSKKGESYYGDAFIASNSDVDVHLQEVYKHANVKNFTDDGKCGETNWRAAGNKSKRKTHLDETGLEIAGCRHGLAQWAVNMFRGEIYGYANFIRVHKMIPNNVEYMWEDIICKYWKWAKNIPDNSMEQQNMKPALSVMHAKAHNWSCQVLWGGRWQEGAACSTGEEVEQINSYLSRICNTTKYMLPESREELITEHAMAWNKRKVTSLAAALFKRYAKTMKGLETWTKELDDALSAVNLQKDSIDAIKWKEDVQVVARDNHSRSTVTEEEEFYLLSKQTSVVTDLLVNLPSDHYVEREYLDNHLKKVTSKYATIGEKRQRLTTLSEKLCKETSDHDVMEKGRQLSLQRALKTIQNELELLSFSIYQRKICIDKLAASSKVRAKLRKKLTADQGQISKRTRLHNEIQKTVGGENLQTLDQISVAEGMFPWTLNDVSVQLKCKIVDKFENLKRHEEELIVIKKEMIQYFHYYKDVIIPKLKSEIKDLEGYLEHDVETSHQASRVPFEPSVKESKYAMLNNRGKTTIMGEIALRHKGIQFAEEQVHIGLQKFSCFNAADFGVFLNEDCEEEQTSDDDYMYDVDDEYMEQLIEDHRQDRVTNWNEDDNECDLEVEIAV